MEPNELLTKLRAEIEAQSAARIAELEKALRAIDAGTDYKHRTTPKTIARLVLTSKPKQNKEKELNVLVSNLAMRVSELEVALKSMPNGAERLEKIKMSEK